MTQTTNVVRLVRDAVGGEAIGAYLHGSSVLGGLRPGSDLDVLVVTRRAPTPRQRRALADGLLDISGDPARPTSDRPIELSVVAQSGVRPWRYPPRCEFRYSEGLRAAIARGVTPQPAPSPDLAVLVTMVLECDAPLFGPPPGEVLDPVPRGDLARAMVAGIPDLLDELESDTGDGLLRLARTWATIATGTVGSKGAAADWVLGQLPDEYRPVLARARDGYLGTGSLSWAGQAPQARRFAAYAVARIEGLAGADA